MTLVVAFAACGPSACGAGERTPTHSAEPPTPTPTPTPAPAPAPTPAPAPAAAPDPQLFDKVVRAEVVFPDAAQRALYEELPVQSNQGDRVYGFALKSQPGMQQDRHFHIITVAVSRVGTRDAGPAGATMGPNGGFWEKVVRTADGRYDIRMTEGTLLPNDVKIPEFDLARAAQAISARYGELAANR